MKYIKNYLRKQKFSVAARLFCIYFMNFSYFISYILLNGDGYVKQIIPFVNDVSLNTNISEITSIALEHNLQMENSDSIVGVFTVSGKYKMNDISVNEEVFEKEIPFDITLDDKYDASKVKIDIDDFYYEIVNEEYLRVHIDVVIDNLIYAREEKKDATYKEEERCIEDENIEDVKSLNQKFKEKESDNNMIDEIPNESETNKIEGEQVKEDSDERKDEITDVAKEIPSNLLLEKEEYVTYKVHIIRNDETIDTIKEKYNITKEELEKYNNLENITLGSKIIVPLKNE